MDKTLGQIAFEAGVKRTVEWAFVRDEFKAEWEAGGSAVAAAVKEEDARICREFGATLETDLGDCFAEEIRASIKEVKS